jgi:hypothetical protein
LDKIMNQNQQHPRRPRIGRAGLFLMAALLPGCASITNVIEARSIPVAGPRNPVVDVACIWQQGEGRDQRGMPCRGFCGQFMFQTRADKKPAIVNGAVTIYVFDNVGTPEEQAKPFEVFNFTAQEWATFARKTNLGMSYQLFVPYTRPGGREAECSLRVKYVPTDSNTPLFSQAENITMKGLSASPATATADALERKLMQGSSPLAQSSLMKPQNSDAVYSQMLKKMQAEARPETASAEPVSTAGFSRGTSRVEIQKLQAILDESSRKVERADYAEPATSRNSVRSADYAAEDEGQPSF